MAGKYQSRRIKIMPNKIKELPGIRHPIDSIGDKRICPITGNPFRVASTDHGLSGCYNVCDSCRPGSPSIGETLHRLHAERKSQSPRYYVLQYGHFWRMTRNKFLAFLEYGAKGQGDWNLDWYGKELKRTPSGIQLFKEDDREWWASIRSSVHLIKPLDWHEDDFREALSQDWK